MAVRVQEMEQPPDPEEWAALARATNAAIRLAGELARRTAERDAWQAVAVRSLDLLEDAGHTHRTLADEVRYWYERCDILQETLNEAIHRLDTGLT